MHEDMIFMILVDLNLMFIVINIKPYAIMYNFNDHTTR